MQTTRCSRPAGDFVGSQDLVYPGRPAAERSMATDFAKLIAQSMEGLEAVKRLGGALISED